MITTRNFLYLFFFWLILIPATVPAQQVNIPSDERYRKGITLFENGIYSQSAEELQKFIEASPGDELLPSAEFYRARALGRADSANVENYYEEYIKEYPNTPFTRRLLFELAEWARSDSNFSAAVTLYDRSLKHKPGSKQSAKIYYWMAETAVSGNEYNRARRFFLTLADRYPDSEWSPKALYARGRLYLSESKFDSSSVAFELLRERYPSDEMTRRIGTALGESYYQQGKYKEAIEALRNAIPHLNEELESKAVYLIAESYNVLNNFDQASTYYLQYINMNKGTDRVRIAHYGLGWVYHKQQIYHWASDSFNKAAPGSDELARKALYYKAVNEKLGSRYNEAINTFRSFGDRYSEGLWVEEAYYEWAVTAYEMGRYSETIEILLDLVRGDSRLEWEGRIYTLLGEAYFANKEYTRALQAFEVASELTNIDPAVKRQARFQKAWVQYSNQAFQQAQPVFEEVYREAPETELGSEALFWSADCHFNTRNFNRASQQFASFAEQNPEHELAGAALYSLGWSYFNLGSYDRAIDPFSTFLEQYEPPSIALYPYDTDAILRLGDSHYATGAYDRAIEVYQKAIGAEPGGDYAMFQVANSYYRSERTYEGVTTFRRMLRIYPYSRLREQAQYNIAYIYLNSGNYTQAVEEFQTVINKYPNTSWAARSQYNIGDAFYNSGNYEQAVEAYKNVLEEYPQSDYLIEAINGIQYAQLSLGQPDSSSAILEDFLADHPQTSTADRLRFRQADNLFQSGDYQNAIDEFRQYIRITNNEELLSDAYFNLANAYEQIDNRNEAMEAYQVIIDSHADSEHYGPALASMGRLHFESGEYAASFDYFDQLRQGGGNSFLLEALTGMGEAQMAMGNIEQARHHFEDALKVNGNHAPSRIGLGKVALRNENYAEARDLFALIAESNTTEVGAEAQYLLGVVQQEQQNYEQALEAYSNVRVLYEAFDVWVARSLLKSAECYLQTGDTGEANNALNNIVENYPDTPEAKQARRMLQSNP